MMWFMVRLVMMSITAPELERRIRMSPIEFLSSLGGLFGLCLGFSIISLVELVYWAVLRSPIPTWSYTFHLNKLFQAAQEPYVETKPPLEHYACRFSTARQCTQRTIRCISS